MGIKTILTLLTVGGIAGGAYYFKDGIKGAFASGKNKAESVKDKLEDGYQGNSSSDTSYTEPISENNENKGYSGKSDSIKGNTEYVYIPIYQNNGQQSAPNKNDAPRDNNKPNPELNWYIKNDKKKTKSSISNTFSSPWARENPTKYAEQKYGINYETLSKASSKTESKRTIDERKALEAAKARDTIFDSRSINNW